MKVDTSRFEEMETRESTRDVRIKNHLMDKRGNKSRTYKTSHRVEKRRNWEE